jgi:Phosphodiester glycosidase
MAPPQHLRGLQPVPSACAPRWRLIGLLVVVLAIVVGLYRGRESADSAPRLVGLLSSSPSINMGRGARTVLKTFSTDGHSFKMRLILFDTAHYELRVVDQPSARDPLLLADACEKLHAVAGCNGGYFNLNFTPHGLMIADGQRFDADIVPSMGGQGGALVVRRDEARLVVDTHYEDGPDATQFLQCCPLFIVDGQPLAIGHGGPRRHRIFLLTDNAGHWAIGSTESITLQELVDAVRTDGTVTEFPVKMALNLDGGRSHGLWWKNASGKTHDTPTSAPVRSYVVVVPRAL